MIDKNRLIKVEHPRSSTSGLEYISPMPLDEYKEWKNVANKAASPRYLHWDDIRRKEWLPIAPAEKAWAIIKVFRGGIETPISTPDSFLFYWTRCAHFDEILHNITRSLSGHIMGLPQVMSEKEKQQYITRGLIEEAIASSQLEGANTTRAYAKKMIQEGLPPRDKSQRMIINNYQAMQKIEEEYKHERLSLGVLHDMHRELTKNNTLDQGKVGEFRTDSDEIYVNGPENDGTIAFIPPEMTFVEKQIQRLIDFANDELETFFIHPVLKAIMLHFWLGYLHPYGDGNGRLARSLFYWYLLRNDYWAFAFLPISEAIKKSPKQYGWAYIYSEQDDNDLTYFLDYNLRKIVQAQESFEEYIFKKNQESLLLAETSRKIKDLNSRQIQIAQFLHSNANETTNVSAVTTIFGISQMTAIRDLRDMTNKGFLYKEKNGRNVFYYPTEKLSELINRPLKPI